MYIREKIYLVRIESKMASLSDLEIKYKIKLKLSLWDCLKLRVIGFKEINIKSLGESSVIKIKGKK